MLVFVFQCQRREMTTWTTVGFSLMALLSHHLLPKVVVGPVIKYSLVSSSFCVYVPSHLGFGWARGGVCACDCMWMTLRLSPGRHVHMVEHSHVCCLDCGSLTLHSRHGECMRVTCVSMCPISNNESCVPSRVSFCRSCSAAQTQFQMSEKLYSSTMKQHHHQDLLENKENAGWRGDVTPCDHAAS